MTPSLHSFCALVKFLKIMAEAFDTLKRVTDFFLALHVPGRLCPQHALHDPYVPDDPNALNDLKAEAAEV